MRLNGSNSRSEEEAIDPQVVKTFAGLGKRACKAGTYMARVTDARKLEVKRGQPNSWNKFSPVACPLDTGGHTVSWATQLTQRTRFNALLAAYTHLNQFRGQSQISTWLTAIVLNSARMLLRRRIRHVHVSLDESPGELQPVSVSERLADQWPTPENALIESELKTRLIHLHRHLSPTLLRTFQLRDVEGRSIRETARILGVPTGTVKAQSARARKRLKELARHWLRPLSHSPSNRVPGLAGTRAWLEKAATTRIQ